MEVLLFFKNLTFLLRKNKEVNHLQKTDFLNYIGVSYQAVKKWEQGGNIKQRHLEWIIRYFNKKLDLKIAVENMLGEDIEMNYENFKLNSDYIKRRDELVEIYWKLDPQIQKELLELLKKVKD
jgi:transcriptional regulator with XRE-family HTH domain